MGNFFQILGNLFKSLFGGQAPSPSDTTTTPPATDTHECGLGMHEIPSATEDNAPFVATTAEAMAIFAEDGVVSAQSIGCMATVRGELGTINVRLGPDVGFDTLVKTQGGVSFPLVGASEADSDGHRWFSVQVGERNGWIRGDLLNLSTDCLDLSYISEDDLQRAAPEPADPPSGRFTPPATSGLTQSYHSGHKGYDLGTPMDTPIRAATDGVIIRRVDCENCNDGSPNIFPCGSFVYSSESWGFGYGNFIIIRHDYASMPATLRAEMDRNGLTNGFVYVLFAHFSRNNVNVGQWVSGGHVLGLTGNHGCSTGPHLHFEVRIGKVESTDGVWTQQIAVNPNLMYDY